MKIIRSIFGHLVGFLALCFVIMLFPGLGSFSETLAELSFMKIHPLYSGGKKIDTTRNKNYERYLHQPVFKSFPQKKKEGFVQITWEGDSLKHTTDTIDYNLDGKRDFSVTFSSAKPDIQILSDSGKIIKMNTYAKTDNGYIIRMQIIR